MHFAPRAPVRFVALITVPLALAACASVGWREVEVVTRVAPVVVEIERWKSEEGRAAAVDYEHPATVNAESLERVLSALRYEGEAKPRRPAIDAALVPRLARAVADGLGRADRQSRVRFAVTNPGEKILFIPVRTTTRGVAFVQPAGRLNLAFDVVDETLEYEDEAWADPVAETLSRGRLVSPPGGRVRADQDLWLTVALTPAMSAPRASTPNAKRVAGAPLEVDTPATSTERPARPSDAKTSDATAPDPAGAALTPPTKPLTDAEIVERLRFLERLYREGTITAEQYADIRRAILR